MKGAVVTQLAIEVEFRTIDDITTSEGSLERRAERNASYLPPKPHGLTGARPIDGSIRCCLQSI